MTPRPEVPLPGSSQPVGGGWQRRGAVPGESPMSVTVYLRERRGVPTLAQRLATPEGAPPLPRIRGTAGLLTEHGPSPADLAALRRHAAAHGLTSGPVEPVSGGVVLRGRASDLGRAFGVELIEQIHPHAVRAGRPMRHHSHEGPLLLPGELEGVVLAVAGLSDRPLARTHFRVAAPPPRPSQEGSSARQVASAYGVPAGSDAAGQTIGLLALGGGHSRADLGSFCRHPSVGVPVPAVADVSVHGAVNELTNGGDPATEDGEVALDIQTVAAVAPGAAIRVYFAPNSDRGFIDALARAVRDRCTVISISWGAPEMLWPFASMIAFDRTCQAAQALGIPIFCAAGDSGSADGVYDRRSHADFPASSPHVVACGGTRLPELSLSRETAWNDLATGGGAGGGAVSDAWPLPAYQAAAQPPASVNDGRHRRTVPDLAANASPETGYRIHVGGCWYVIGGTSVVAPLLAGMTALINSELDRRLPGARLGDFNSHLYSRFASGGALHDIADGSSNGGHYFARPGYDAVTGWGSPDYRRMLSLSLEALRPPERRAPALEMEL